MLEGKPLLVVIGGSDTGRTPMVAGLARAALGDQVHVQTAGVLAHIGESAMTEAQMALEQLGINIRSHHAQPLSPIHRRHADLLLAVDRGTALVLHSEFPGDDRVVSLASLCNQPDILDPHRMPLGVWVATAQQLKGQIQQALPAIRQRLGITNTPPTPDVTAPSQRDDDVVAQMSRLLQTAEMLPMIVDWNRVRHELVQQLRTLATSDSHDLLPAAVLMIEGWLTYHPTQPSAEALQQVRRVIEHLRGPFDSAALVLVAQQLISTERNQVCSD